jgi:hypothetical protein
MHLRFRRAAPGGPEPARLHDPPALEAGPGMSRYPRGDELSTERGAGDLVKTLRSLPAVLPDLLPPFAPYALVLAAFGAFIVWNGGIVLGATPQSGMRGVRADDAQATRRTTSQRCTSRNCSTSLASQRSWAGPSSPRALAACSD